MGQSRILQAIPKLCRADHSVIERWLSMGIRRSFCEILPIVLLANLFYGLSLGSWHGYEMALYVGIKFPLAILLTLGITGTLNGLFSVLTGSGISFKQSFQFQLLSFAIFGIILASLSPLVFFLAKSSPDPLSTGMAQAYRIFLISNVFVIAFSGIASQFILLKFLRIFSSNNKAANRVFIQWLGLNLLVGAEVTHILRPFFGSPALEVEFLREDMFDGNFYEVVFHSLRSLI